MKNLKHLKTYESFGSDKLAYNEDELISYIENNSSLVLNNEKDEEVLIFTTRKHGDVGSETYSDIDYKECIELVKVLKEKFPNYTYNIDTVDEWVNINAKKRDFYKNYEPEPNNIGYVLSYVRKDGTNIKHAYESRREFGPYSGIDKHREWLKEICDRFIVDKTYEEVLAIADNLVIPKEYGYSEKALIQEAGEYEDIPYADFYIQRREIW